MSNNYCRKNSSTSSCRALRLEPPRVAPPPPPPPSLPLLLSLASGRWTGCLEHICKVGIRIWENPRLCANMEPNLNCMYTLVTAKNCWQAQKRIWQYFWLCLTLHLTMCLHPIVCFLLVFQCFALFLVTWLYVEQLLLSLFACTLCVYLFVCFCHLALRLAACLRPHPRPRPRPPSLTSTWAKLSFSLLSDLIWFNQIQFNWMQSVDWRHWLALTNNCGMDFPTTCRFLCLKQKCAHSIICPRVAQSCAGGRDLKLQVLAESVQQLGSGAGKDV